jgi:hypothetical protein
MSKYKPIRFKDPTITGEVYEQVKEIIKRHPLATSAVKVVLASAAIGGVLAIGVAAPGILGSFGKMQKATQNKKRQRYQELWRSFYKLKQANAFKYVGESNGEMVYQFTDNGKIKLQKFIIDNLEIKKPKKWDKRWRVVIFDIPEELKNIRRIFQEKLKELGFYCLQKSVWVHPFPCEQEINVLKEFYTVYKYVTLLHVVDMPDGRVLYYFRNTIKDTL